MHRTRVLETRIGDHRLGEMKKGGGGCGKRWGNLRQARDDGMSNQIVSSFERRRFMFSIGHQACIDP
jgi:hypothetical protein